MKNEPRSESDSCAASVALTAAMRTWPRWESSAGVVTMKGAPRSSPFCRSVIEPVPHASRMPMRTLPPVWESRSRTR